MKKNLPGEVEARLKEIENAPYAIALKMETVSVGDGEAVVRMSIKGMTNALGNGHGGAVYSLADQAFALAANSEGDPQVALTVSISYLKPSRGDLVATARKVGESRTTGVYEVLVHDGEQLVAIFQGIGYRLRKRENR